MPHDLTCIETPEQYRANWLVPARHTLTRAVTAGDQEADITDVLDVVRWVLGRPGATMRLRDANGILSSEMYLTSHAWRAVGLFLALRAMLRGGPGNVDEPEWSKDEKTGDVLCAVTFDALNFRNEVLASVTSTCSTSEKLGSSNLSRWSNSWQLLDVAQERGNIHVLHGAIGFLIEQIDGYSTAVLDIAAENYEATLIDADGTVVTPW